MNFRLSFFFRGGGGGGKQISNRCVDVVTLHLDEIRYRAHYPSDIFDSLLKDCALLQFLNF